MKKLFGTVAVGALLTSFVYVLSSGGRRAMVRRKLTALFGRGQELQPSEAERAEPNDPTLKAKVESELFRDEHVPKGQISVATRYGVVELRGEVPDESLIEELVARVRSVPGVKDVENLMHAPGVAAPMHQ